MQTTLLGIAVAMILALVAALVGPLLIDWNRFRPSFEAEASRLIGAPVRVTGTINAVVLPTPSLTVRGLEIGSVDGEQIQARSLSVEFYLGSLIQGHARARELHLAGLDLHLGVTSSGEPALPNLAPGFDPDALSIERLNIEDGRAVFSDGRSGAKLILENLSFSGDVRSLAGPFKGDGAFVTGGHLYGYRIAAGRAEEGAIKLRLNLDPVDRPLTVTADGTLFQAGEAPRFEGSLVLSRPAGVTLPNGQAVTNEPWRLSSRVKASTASALLQQLEFQYGPTERPVKLTGTAELTFGSKPRFDGVLSANQMDLDRTFAATGSTRLLPFAAVRILGNGLSAALGPSIPARVGVSVDLLTLGGATVHSLRGDVTTDGDGWNLEGVQLRAPGLTQVKLSGRLDTSGQQITFAGPVSVDSSDPAGLAAWLKGAPHPAPGGMRPLSARGEVTFGTEKFGIERLTAQIDRKQLEGRLAYLWPSGEHPARLEADLNAAELDIDALIAVAGEAKSVTHFEPPREVMLGIAADRTLIAGVEARQLNARLRRDAKVLQIERFSVADFGGAAFEASGEIDTALPSPRGFMKIHLNATEFSGIAALLKKFAPEMEDRAAGLARSWPATELDATLSLQETAQTTSADLAIEGHAGVIRLSLTGNASRSSADLAGGDWHAWAGAGVRLQGKIEADDGTAVIDLLNLGKIVAVAKGHPGLMTVTAKGPLGGDLAADSQLQAGGLDASAKGTLRFAGYEPKADLHLTVTAADARPLRRNSDQALPAALAGNLALTSKSLSLGNFSGTIAGTNVRGNLQAAFGQRLGIQGRVEADDVDVPAAIGAAVGISAAPDAHGNTWAWSQEPFSQGWFEDIDGQVEFKFAQAHCSPGIALRQVQGVAAFSRYAIAFSDIQAVLADGRTTGELIFNKNEQSVSASVRFRLANANAAALLGKTAGSPITGRLALQVEAQAAGLSPQALMGSLSGNGVISLSQAQLAGLDAKVFGVATQTVEQGMPPETAKISEVVTAALDNGSLTVPSAEGVLTIAGGQVRLTKLAIQARDAELTATGTIDLREGDLAARLALSAPGGPDRPAVLVSLKGPIEAPKRSVDVTALTTWLTLRAVDQQTKRLEAMEAKSGALAIPGTTAPPLPTAIEIPALPPIVNQPPTRLPGEKANGSASGLQQSPAKPGLPAIASPPPLPDLSAHRNN